MSPAKSVHMNTTITFSTWKRSTLIKSVGGTNDNQRIKKLC
jgi:hypothetical protein